MSVDFGFDGRKLNLYVRGKNVGGTFFELRSSHLKNVNLVIFELEVSGNFMDQSRESGITNRSQEFIVLRGSNREETDLLFVAERCKATDKKSIRH